jgi:excisionase family DNA binding protein
MRTIRDTAKWFKDHDPETEITEFAIRQMIKEGTIPAVKTGNKFLVNLDAVLERFGADQVNSAVING